MPRRPPRGPPNRIWNQNHDRFQGNQFTGKNKTKNRPYLRTTIAILKMLENFHTKIYN